MSVFVSGVQLEIRYQRDLLVKITTFIGTVLLVSRSATDSLDPYACPCDGSTVTPSPMRALGGGAV